MMGVNSKILIWKSTHLSSWKLGLFVILVGASNGLLGVTLTPNVLLWSFAFLTLTLIIGVFTKAPLISPLNFVGFGFGLYYILPITEHLFIGKWPFYQPLDSESQYLVVIAAVFLGWIGVLFGNKLIARVPIAVKPTHSDGYPTSLSRLFLVGIAAFLIGFIGIVIGIILSGGISSWVGRSWVERGSSGIYLFLNRLMEAGVYSVAGAGSARARTNLPRGILWTSLALLMSFVLFLLSGFGARIILVRPLLITAMIWVLNRRKPVRLRHMLPTFVLVLLLMIVWGTLRDKVGLNVFFYGDSYLLILDKLDAFYLFDSFILLLNNMPSGVPFLLGQSYLKLLYILVPREIWPAKPETITTWVLHVFRPELWSQGVSIGPSFLGEAYANFGWLGIGVAGVVLGIVVGKITSLRRKIEAGDVVSTIIYSVGCWFSFEEVRGDFQLVTLAWLLILFYVLAIVKLSRIPSRG